MNMHSHHSHSGTYVSHGADDLDSIVASAERKGFTVFCLTEHMPRLENKYLYPEETAKNYTTDNLKKDFGDFLSHAKEIQKKYNEHGKMRVLVGFEVEGINEEHIQYSKSLLDNGITKINLSIGSVHYVNDSPIDFNQELWFEARDKCENKSTRSLFYKYFEAQFAVLKGLKPTVIGHFDLIRLFSPQNERDPSTDKLIKDVDLKIDWPEVWALVETNVKLVVEYGGLFELNSSAFRKGWNSPYPLMDICNCIVENGGKFCLSDDSHSIVQVGMNLHRAFAFARDVLHLTHIYHLEVDGNNDTKVVKNSVEEIDTMQFWKQYHDK